MFSDESRFSVVNCAHLEGCTVKHCMGPTPGVLISGKISFHSRSCLLQIASNLNGQR